MNGCTSVVAQSLMNTIFSQPHIVWKGEKLRENRSKNLKAVNSALLFCSFKHSYQPGQIRVLAGTIDWRNNMHDKGMQLIQVAKVFVHDGWDRQTGQNDVGLLETSTPIMYTTQNGKITVNRVCLPMDQQEFTTGNALSSGWGFMSKYSRFTPDILRKVEIPIVTYETCKNAFSSVIGITTNQVCAGIVNKGNCMVS